MENRLQHFFGPVLLPVLEELDLAVDARFAEGVKFTHAARSQPGEKQHLAGLRGPLFLRGQWPLVWPLLLLAAELQLGKNTPTGQGLFRPCWLRNVLDRRLARHPLWQTAAAHVAQAGEDRGTTSAPLSGAELKALAQGCSSDPRFSLEPARAAALPRRDLSKAPREIAVLGPREKVIHRALLELLRPCLEPLFAPASIGFRQGLSRDSARNWVSEAVREGCTHAVEVDVASFFDSVPWDRLEAVLARSLPSADRQTLALLNSVIRQPLARPDGTPVPRSQGLLQGSPLSPLLANLYLTSWAERLLSQGCRLVRYGDDVLLLTRSREEAVRALDMAERLLADLELTLNRDKTAIVDIGAGFRFLGLELGPDTDLAGSEENLLRRTLYLAQPGTWAGLDGQAVAVREGEAQVGRVPLEQINHLVLAGAGGISTALITVCREHEVPVTVADASGRVRATFHGQGRSFYQRLAAHGARHAGLSSAERVRLAAEVVRAKLAGYLAWWESLPPAEVRGAGQELHLACKRLESRVAQAEKAGVPDLALALDELRGIEGRAALLTFRWTNDRAAAVDAAWASEARHPHERADRWNALVDTLSFLLFCRFNAWLRARGLNPWLGLLHSPAAAYESLVCDLQEPFRARLDRLALKLVNQLKLPAGDCQPGPQGQWRFNSAAWSTIVRAFETELDCQRAGDPTTWRRMIDWQVEALRLWADRGQPLRILQRELKPGRKW